MLSCMSIRADVRGRASLLSGRMRHMTVIVDLCDDVARSDGSNVIEWQSADVNASLTR